MRTRTDKMLFGAKVMIREESEAGFGEIAEYLPGGRVDLHFYQNPVDFERRVVPIKALTREDLPEETRCYVTDPAADKILVGRLLVRMGSSEGSKLYRIQFPNGEIRTLSETDFHVRSYIGGTSPVEALCALGIETPHFFEFRDRWVRELAAQRSACQGIEAIASSRIELFPHQVEVVRRVLQDPVVRYLLADEVGLGKTIEAGIVLRQMFLDDPAIEVAVLVPNVLVDQWREELEQRFGLTSNDLVILPHSQLPTLAGRRFDCVVIDEAHEVVVVEGAASSVRLFDAAQQVARNSAHILLLTATPALHDSEEFLRILHLLAPHDYQLTDLGGFRKKLDLRKGIGRALFQLQKATHPVSIKRGAERIAGLLSTDPTVQRLVDSMKSLADESEVRDIANELRIHLAESYRIHRRMIRTRRGGLVDMIRPRQRPLEEFAGEDDACARLDGIWEALEEWRIEASGTFGDDTSRPELARLYCRLAETLDVDQGEWLRTLDRIEGVLGSHASVRHLKILRERRWPDAGGDRVGLLIQILSRLFSRPGDGKWLVFCSTPERCERIWSSLPAEMLNAVAVAHSDQGQDERDQHLKRFRIDVRTKCLLADASVEAGGNLQFVAGLIFFDLPWSLMRLEQRMGRVDRLGRRDLIPTRILLTNDHPLALDLAWNTILAEGFGLYSESLADLQFVFEKEIADLQELAFDSGPQSLSEQGDGIRERVKAAREDLAEQDIIDGLWTEDLEDSDLWRSLEDGELREKSFGKALSGYLAQNFNFRHTASGPGGAIIEYSPIRIRGQILQPLMPIHQLARMAPHLRKRGTTKRVLATKDRSLAFRRPGHPFIDDVHRLSDWDDRGRAFAMFRKVGWFHEPRYVFRLRVIYEVSPEFGEQELGSIAGRLARGAIKRLVTGWFPVGTVELFLGFDGTPAEDDLIAICSRPYNDGDMNLGGKRADLIRGLFGANTWPITCRSVAQAAIDQVRDSQQMARARDDALAKAKEHFRMVGLRLESRARAKLETSRSAQSAMMEAQDLAQRVDDAIRVPAIRIDSMGLYVLGNASFLEDFATERS